MTRKTAPEAPIVTRPGTPWPLRWETVHDEENRSGSPIVNPAGDSVAAPLETVRDEETRSGRPDHRLDPHRHPDQHMHTMISGILSIGYMAVALLIALGVIITAFLRQMIIKPILIMADAAREFGAGDLKAKIAVESGDRSACWRGLLMKWPRTSRARCSAPR